MINTLYNIIILRKLIIWDCAIAGKALNDRRLNNYVTLINSIKKPAIVNSYYDKNFYEGKCVKKQLTLFS